KLTSNDFTLSSKRNTDAKVRRVGKISLGIGVGGTGGWLAIVVVVMMDGVIVDLGEGIGVTVDEPVVKMDSIPGSIIGFNRLVTNDDIDELSC
nr:hypothetical protein [Tanacetum cinerariifolium]